MSSSKEDDVSIEMKHVNGDDSVSGHSRASALSPRRPKLVSYDQVKDLTEVSKIMIAICCICLYKIVHFFFLVFKVLLISISEDKNITNELQVNSG